MGILVNPSIINHLRKYFDLARTHYQQGDLGLAVFFAITLVEECAKILYLRDADLKDKKQRKAAINHQEKRLVALINLLTASEQFDSLPRKWQDLVWTWFSEEYFMKLRNDSLYLRFNYRGELTIPDETIAKEQAALLVYLAGFSAVELGEYVDLNSAWTEYIRQNMEDFRATYLEE